MNVYFIEDEGQVTLFDAGISSMTKSIQRHADELGGLKRIVLGHAHLDHRGGAAGLGAPIYCHAADKEDAETDGGMHYFSTETLPLYSRAVMRGLLRYWDGGPLKISGTVAEGEDVAGFEVVHIPGHSPGQIVLWRASDRVALTTDCFYTLDPLSGRKGAPRLPLPSFNWDQEQTRTAVAKLAALDPVAAWPGHADPLLGDVARQLEPVHSP
jgi:glyoxylase-like metal-dependent hydrolase (beta-lactamase superfamily II)